MLSSASARVFTSHNQFYLLEPGAALNGAPTTPENGLITVLTDGSAHIYTGTHTGEISVTVELHDQPPPLDLDYWQDVVEVSVPAPTGQLRVGGLTAETETESLLPSLSHAGPGTYRLRVHARGRDGAASADDSDDANESYAWEAVEEYTDDDYDGAEDHTDPTDEFLIAVWPAPEAPAIHHKLTGAFGAELRAAAR